MRFYLTTKAARHIYMMIVPTITAGCTLKSSYNASQSARLFSFDSSGRKIAGSDDIPPIESLANREHCLLVLRSAYCKK